MCPGLSEDDSLALCILLGMEGPRESAQSLGLLEVFFFLTSTWFLKCLLPALRSFLTGWRVSLRAPCCFYLLRNILKYLVISLFLYVLCSGVSLQDERSILRGHVWAGVQRAAFRSCLSPSIVGLGDQIWADMVSSFTQQVTKSLFSVAATLTLLPFVLISVISTPSILHDYLICSEKIS